MEDFELSEDIVTGKAVSKFCAKFLHQQVLRHEAYLAGDIATSLQKFFLRPGPSSFTDLILRTNENIASSELVKEALESSESDVVVKLNPDKDESLKTKH
ncbi:hypothetical protein KIW84_034772 [Lathyrus oleraceus]|uniref:Uncharacterized protein n=1 Tax=Pisum sativum TaxID=3888 RepID=A0A9D4XZA9_PEA|nr:hypothetical protein KIW84_034772 [Pisum sativum]